MNLTWELGDLAHSAEPSVVLEGYRMLPLVSDVVPLVDGGVEGMIRGEYPQYVTLVGKGHGRSAACTCGTRPSDRSCAHVIAVEVRRLQLFADLGAQQLDGWAHRVEALQHLASGWTELARYWTSARRTDPHATSSVMRDAGSLRGGLDVADALARMVDAGQLSTYLVELAADHDITGDSALSPVGRREATELVDYLYHCLNRSEAASALAEVALIATRSLRLSATEPREDLGLWGTLATASGVVGRLVTGGHMDASTAAAGLLKSEGMATPSRYPWIAMVLERLGRASHDVATEMQELVDADVLGRGRPVPTDRRDRIRAELAVARGGASCLLSVLESWDGAPYGEFLYRQAGSWTPLERLDLLSSASRSGRLRWAPGWPSHVPSDDSAPPLHVVHGVACGHSAWSDIAIGDLVVELARRGRDTEALEELKAHTRRAPGPAHRYEFARICRAAGLEGGVAAWPGHAGTAPALDDVERVLEAISRIPERFFCCAEQDQAWGLGSALLASALFQEIPPGERGEHVHAPVWADSILSSYRGAKDDLEALARPRLEEIVTDRGEPPWIRSAVGRASRLARRLVDTTGFPMTTAEVHCDDLGALLAAALGEEGEERTTAGLTHLFVTRQPSTLLDGYLERFVVRAVGTTKLRQPPTDLLELARTMEPRGAGRAAYQLGVVIAELARKEPVVSTSTR